VTDSVCVYGPAWAHDSWCRISRGMYKGLCACGVSASFVDLRDIVLEQDEGLPKGYDAEIGVYCGPPEHMSVLRRTGKHRERLVMIAANSSWLPPEVIDHAAHVCTGLLGPSSWACEVLRQQGSGLPVFLWHHGIDEAFRPASAAGGEAGGHPEGAPWRVLHLASTGLERKGTLQLVEAWIMCCRDGRLPLRASLELVVSAPHGYVRRGLCELDPSGKLSTGIGLFSRLNASEERMATLYPRYDLVCQPSRAEGFGLVPLEALACGVPVAATLCTGHADHLAGRPGVVRIAHGEEAPSDDGPGATAPSVCASEVADALDEAYRGRRRAAGPLAVGLASGHGAVLAPHGAPRRRLAFSC
jgi:hypothetical protein